MRRVAPSVIGQLMHMFGQPTVGRARHVRPLPVADYRRPIAAAMVLAAAMMLSGTPVLAQTTSVAAGQAGSSGANKLATVAARALGGAAQGAAQTDGVVEAVRQAVIAAQVQGAVLALPVKAGDSIKAGQTLVRLDGRAAAQQAQSSRAQVQAIEAQLALARRDLDRQRQLHAQQFISQGALDQAQARYQATEAESKAQIAQAQAAGTVSDLHALQAPFHGWVSQVHVAIGDMATPGKPLLTVYDPSQLRIAVQVPEAWAARLQVSAQRPVRVQVQDQSLDLAQATVVPAVDPITRTVTVQLPLPAASGSLASLVKPGAYVRADFSAALASAQMSAAADPSGMGKAVRVAVPAASVIRRGELTGVYVVDAQGNPRLRQLRLGSLVPVHGTSSADQAWIEVLAGLSAGEAVAVDPLAALRVLATASAAVAR